MRHCVRDCQVSLPCALRDKIRKDHVLFPIAMYVLHRYDAKIEDGKKDTYKMGKNVDVDALYRDKRRQVKSDCCRTVSGLAR